MSWHDCKIDSADAAFSKAIRLRDRRCIICGQRGTPDKDGLPIVGLQCSHFKGRGHESVRFDLKNCDSMCSRHHKIFEAEKKASGIYYKFKLEQLGEQEFNLLILRANTYHKRDRKLELIKAKELLRIEIARLRGGYG